MSKRFELAVTYGVALALVVGFSSLAAAAPKKAPPAKKQLRGVVERPKGALPKREQPPAGASVGRDHQKGEGMAPGKVHHRGEGGKVGQSRRQDGTDHHAGHRGDTDSDKGNAAEANRRALEKRRRMAVVHARRAAMGRNPTISEHLKRAAQKKDGLAREQKKNLRRLARLRRLAVVAEEKGDEEMAGRVETLIQKESARHNRVLERLARKGHKGHTGHKEVQP